MGWQGNWDEGSRSIETSQSKTDWRTPDRKGTDFLGRYLQRSLRPNAGFGAPTYADYQQQLGPRAEFKDVNPDLYTVGTPQTQKELENTLLATNQAGATQGIRSLNEGLNPGIAAAMTSLGRYLGGGAGGLGGAALGTALTQGQQRHKGGTTPQGIWQRAYGLGAEGIRRARTEREQLNAAQGIAATGLQAEIDRSRSQQRLGEAQSIANLRSTDAGLLAMLLREAGGLWGYRPYSETSSFASHTSG